MYNTVPFKGEHIKPLLEQPSNMHLKNAFPDELLGKMEESGVHRTFLYGETPMFCGGLYEFWPGRAEIWAVFNEETKENFVPVFRGIKKYLDESPVTRIELAVPCEFDKGKRRASLLGFKLETERAHKYLPGGIDCSLFARVK